LALQNQSKDETNTIRLDTPFIGTSGLGAGNPSSSIGWFNEGLIPFTHTHLQPNNPFLK